MKKIKKLSLFIGLLTIPFLAVACETENHYKYEGDGAPRTQYVTIPSGYTLAPIDSSTSSQITSTPSLNNPPLYNYPAFKVFDSFETGTIPSDPITFQLDEYYPSRFVIDNHLDVIQLGNNRFIGNALSLYMVDVDGDGYRDFCMGAVKDENGLANEYISVYSYKKGRNLYYLSERNLINTANYRFSLENNFLYIKRHLTDPTDYETGMVSFDNNLGFINVIWNNKYAVKGLTQKLANATNSNSIITSLTSGVHHANTAHDVVYSLTATLNMNGYDITPAYYSKVVSLAYRTSDEFIDIVETKIKGSSITLLFTLNDQAKDFDVVNLELRAGSYIAYFALKTSGMATPYTLGSALGSTIISSASYAKQLVSRIDYTRSYFYEPFSYTQIYSNSDTVDSLCDLLDERVYPIDYNTYSLFLPDKENDYFDYHTPYGEGRITFKDNRFLVLNGRYYMFLDTIDIDSYGAFNSYYYSFYEGYDLFVESINNPSQSYELYYAHEMHFLIFDNNGQYSKTSAKYKFVLGGANYFIVSKSAFVDETEEHVYILITANYNFQDYV